MSEITEDKRITDVGAGICKAVVNAIPVVNFVQTVYDEYATRQWQQRREKFEEVFEEKFQDLQDEIDLNKINKIPNFSQILSQATQGAMGDIEEDKIKFYVNVAINAIKTEKLEDTKTHIFLNMLRDFSVLHIRVLEFLSKTHNAQYGIMQSGMKDTLSTCIESLDRYADETEKDLFANETMFLLVLGELYRNKLVVRDDVNNMTPTIIGEMKKQTTSLGDEFLNFISDCEEPNV